MTKGDLRVAFFLPVKRFLQANEDQLWEPGLPARAVCQASNRLQVDRAPTADLIGGGAEAGADAEDEVGWGLCWVIRTTLEAAKGCPTLNMKVLMGAPNVVRGGSHSGNVAAAGLAAESLLDILPSDDPVSLLQAASGRW